MERKRPKQCQEISTAITRTKEQLGTPRPPFGESPEQWKHKGMVPPRGYLEEQQQTETFSADMQFLENNFHSTHFRNSDLDGLSAQSECKTYLWFFFKLQSEAIYTYIKRKKKKLNSKQIWHRLTNVSLPSLWRLKVYISHTNKNNNDTITKTKPPKLRIVQYLCFLYDTFNCNTK